MKLPWGAALLLLPWLTCPNALAQVTPEPILRNEARFQPIAAQNGMVVSAEAQATRIGVEILQAGGNAVDAAVAMGFALAVTYPRAGNLGGGGFMLVYLAEENRTVAIDYRERAPMAASRDMFLDREGKVDRERSRFSRQAAGVPGTVAGLLHALEKYGTLPRRKVMAPAIRLARKGFPVSPGMASALARWSERLARDPGARALLFNKDGSTLRAGQRLRQPTLARTLKAVSRHGKDGFYQGPVAKALEADMRAGGGLLTAADLARYRVTERKPIAGNYRGYRVVSMPPPSSGGVHLLQMLNILEGYPIAEYGAGSARTLHLAAEAMRRAYADRSRYLGDTDFTPVPLPQLTAKDYAARLRKSINEKQATPSDQVAPGAVLPEESRDTTHYSIVDAKGNAVANTYTLNYSYGSGILVPALGFFLNNEMNDFATRPGEPDGFGLVSGEANAIQPDKRPLSSMTPTLLFKDGKLVLVTGSPGGSTIINTVLQIIMNFVDHGMNPAEAVAAPRVHHQWMPDILLAERGISPDTLGLLREAGHKLVQGRAIGNAGTISIGNGWLYGAADARRSGGLALGH